MGPGTKNPLAQLTAPQGNSLRDMVYGRYLEPASERLNALARMLGGFVPPEPRNRLAGLAEALTPRPQDIFTGSADLMRGLGSADANAALGGLSLMAMGAMDAVPGGKAGTAAARAVGESAGKPGAQAFLETAFSTKGLRGGAATKANKYKSDFESGEMAKILNRGGPDADAMLGAMARIVPFSSSPQHAFSGLYKEIITPGIVSDAAKRLSDVADFAATVEQRFGVRPKVDVNSLGSVYVTIPGVTTGRGSQAQFRFSDHASKRTPSYLSVDPVSGNSSEDALAVIQWVLGGRKGTAPVVGKTKVDPDLAAFKICE
jgi:hypothetical protein